MKKRTKTRVIGTPGAYARTLEQKAASKAFPLLAGTGIGVLGAAYVFMQGNTVVAGVLAAIGIACRVAAEKHLVAKRKARIGRINEEVVAKQLKKCGANLVAHGQVIGYGGDCDHIVAGSCLVAIETKTGSGRVAYKNGKLVAGRRTIPGDPIKQVARQRDNLSRVTSKSAVGVVVVSDMTNAPFTTADGISVIPVAHLRAFLAACPQVLNSADIQTLERKFNQAA